MSPDRPTLRDRFREDLRSGSLPVLLTAVPLAMIVGLGSLSVHSVDDGTAFLLLMTIGVFVPYVHETHWSKAADRRWSRDVAWTLVASVVAGGLFGAGYLLAGLVIDDPTTSGVLAFVATIVGGEVLSRLLRD